MLLVLNWDGKTITGTINPGTDNIAVKNATLNPKAGSCTSRPTPRTRPAADHLRLDGKIENLPLPNRTHHRHLEEASEESGAFKISQAIGDVAMRYRASARGLRGRCVAAAGGRALVGASRDPRQVRRHQADDAQRHRDARRLAQSARARVHERGRRQAGASTGRSSSRARSICERSGWTRDTLQPGDAITVAGHRRRATAAVRRGASRS